MEQKYNEICCNCLSTILNAEAIRNFSALSDKQLKILFSNFYYIVDKFPRQLGLLIFNAPNKHSLFTLADNLLDELGGPENVETLNFAGLHVNLLGGLMHGLGFTQDELESITPLPETDDYINFLNEGYLNKPFIEAIAYIAAGMEAIFPEIAKRIYTTLSARFTDEQLVHFKEHMSADVKHDQQLRKMIYPLLEEDGAIEKFEKGANEVSQRQLAMLTAFLRA